MTFNGKPITEQMSANVDYYENPCPLSKKQLDLYWEQGYIIIKNIFDKPTLNLFKDRFIQICNEREVAKHYSIVKDPALYEQNAKPEMYINKIQELLYDPIYTKYTEDHKILQILTQIIGEDITAVNCMLINKPPGTRDHPPHQDLYYFPFRPADKIVAVWTAIDRVHQNNGCLYVIPGSHRVETLYNYCDRATEKKQFYHGIQSEETAAPVKKRVHLEMEPGDTVVFHPYIVHGSGANISKEYRKCITAHFANSACHYIDVTGTPQEFLADCIMKEAKKRFGDKMEFIDLWKMKSKPVQGVRSRL